MSLSGSIVLTAIAAVSPNKNDLYVQELHTVLYDQQKQTDSQPYLDGPSIDTLPPSLQIAEELLSQEDIEWSTEKVEGCDCDGKEMIQYRYQAIFEIGGQKAFVRIIKEGESAVSIEVLDLQNKQESGLPIPHSPTGFFRNAPAQHIKFLNGYEEIIGRGYGLNPKLPINRLILF